jgi:hypothetical protein
MNLTICPVFLLTELPVTKIRRESPVSGRDNEALREHSVRRQAVTLAAGQSNLKGNL